MSRITETCTFLTKRILPWALALAVPVACASKRDGESVGEVSSALTTTIGMEADAYVRSGSPGSNFGSATTILADGSDGGSILEAYVRFTIPAVTGMTSAKLRLRVADGTSGTYNVRQVASTTWSESGITYSNKPAIGAVVTSFNGATKNTWLELDISSIAQPNTALSLAIVTAGSTNGVDFHSKEATAADRPQVVIESGGGSGGSGSGGSSGSSGSSGSAGTSGSGGVGSIPTDANLKIAFVGDTSDGSNWGSVLSLILQEQAHAVFVQGDMTYNDNPASWWSRTEGVVGQSYPVFLSRGNHDDNTWSGFQTEANNHLGGATRTNAQSDSAYLTVFRGLAVGHIRKGESAATLDGVFNGDDHIWKICSWHQNQQTMQVGGKTDEMGWGVYNRCRDIGALIQTAHEHTYHRTKTLTNPQTWAIDSTCSSGANLCVGPGRTFVTVSGLGGNSVRTQARCTPSSTTSPFPSLNTSDTSCPIWAAIFTSNQGATYGAQFITFNVGGDPKKATGYFKTISGATHDPFTVTHD
ncbi:MAG TPA: DNRLRE domain-containing protein [Polyangiaceae bacterium]|nr:DNRLRE domain-containing protein [Polyangiaceae bacterium]